MTIQYFDDGSTYDDGMTDGFDGSPGQAGATPATDTPDNTDYTFGGSGSTRTPTSTADVNSMVGSPTPGALAGLNKWLKDAGITSKDLTWGDLLAKVGGLTAAGAAVSQGLTPRVSTNFDDLKKQAGAGGMAPSAQDSARMGSLFSRPMVAGSQMAKSYNQGTAGLRKFAHGGGLEMTDRFVRGQGGGQDDKVDARLSPGEYVFDADVVSALGDGNNEEGARKLDQVRANIRAHKRSAPADSIPPKAKPIEKYLKGAK